MTSIAEIESGTALQHVEGFVWCDKWNEVHSDTLNPQGYVLDGKQDYCKDEDHRPIFMEPYRPRIERGTPFICYCRCHGPAGFKLLPGQEAAPGMRPCAYCVSLHP